MLAINTAIFFVILLLLSFKQVRSLRPPGMVRKNYCSDCPVKETSLSKERECYKPPGGEEPHWCCKCKAGTFSAKPCWIHKPNTTICTPCPSDTYTSEYNNVTKCFKSRPFCDDLPHTEFVRGSASENNKCVCISGTYSTNPEESGCKPHFECPEGFGVLTPGNSSHDVTCEHCKDGYCSSTISSKEKCKPCSATLSPKKFPTIDATDFIVSTTITTGTTAGANEDETTIDFATTNEQGGDSTGLIIGIVLGIIIAVIGIAALLWCCCCCKKKKQGAELREVKSQPAINGAEEGKNLLSESQGNDDVHSRSPDLENNEKKPKSKSKESKRMKSSISDQVKYVKVKDAKSDDCDTEEIISGEVFESVEGEVKAQPINPVDVSKNTKLTADQYTDIFHQKKHNVLHYPRTEGDCQFEAFLWTKDGFHENVTTLRNQVAEYLVNNKEDFEGHVEGNFEEYIDEVRNNRYGDENTLRALATIRKKKITVIQTFHDGFEIEPRDNIPAEGEPIVLGHVDEDHGMHYVRLSQIDQQRLSIVSSIDNGQTSTSIQDHKQLEKNDLPPASARAGPIADIQNQPQVHSISSANPSHSSGDNGYREELDNTLDPTVPHRHSVSGSNRSRLASVSSDVSFSNPNENTEGTNDGMDPSLDHQDFVPNGQTRRHDLHLSDSSCELPTRSENCQIETPQQNSNNRPTEHIEVDLVHEIIDMTLKDHKIEIIDEAGRQNIEKLLDTISDIGKKMLKPLEEKMHDSVRTYLRSVNLLDENIMDDIEKDNKGVKEIRHKWIIKITERYGRRKLTPRFLLNLKYEDLVFKDDMMAVFIKELVLPSLPQAR